MEQQQRVCIFRKEVHESERKWSRLVVPQAQVPNFVAIQDELNARGSDIAVYIKDDNGNTWRWVCRMTVMRPMLLELGPFYTAHNVSAGDTVLLWRDMRTSVLSVELQRGPGPAPVGQLAAPAPVAVAAPAPVAVAAPATAAYASAPAAPAFAAGHVPAQPWARGASRALASGRQRSPVHSEDDDDYTPTAASARRAAAHGPLAVRRTLHKQHQQQQSAEMVHDDSGSDEESSDIYSAAQIRRFNALLAVAERMSQSP